MDNLQDEVSRVSSGLVGGCWSLEFVAGPLELEVVRPVSDDSPVLGSGLFLFTKAWVEFYSICAWLVARL